MAALAAAVAVAAIASTALAEHTEITHISTGPAGGNGAFDAYFDDASQDGTRVFIETQESLVASDTDTMYDIYERAGGATTLISTGPGGGNGAFDVYLDEASEDGTRVFFETQESLVASDTDSKFDMYERAAGATTLVSTGPAGGNGAFDAFYNASYLAGVSQDGTHAFFSTSESLVASDTDTMRDVYERAGGVTTLVSTGPAGGNGALPADFYGVSEDGMRAYIATQESLVVSDTDSMEDVYERAGGATTLVSTGPAGGNGAFPAFISGASPDGTRVFVATLESLVASDTDSMEDVYERAGGATTLVSTGPAGGNGTEPAFFDDVSEDGTRVFFSTQESLVASDTDSPVQDVYERAGGVTTQISTGPAGGNGGWPASFSGASQDGTRVFFDTYESLVAADSDNESHDVYERAAGGTTLVSTGPASANGTFDAFFRSASEDGTRVFFETNESLVAADTDSVRDVYERAGGATTLISTGPAGGNGAFPTSFGGAAGDGTRVFFATHESLVGSDTDSSADVYEKGIPAPPPPPPVGGGGPGGVVPVVNDTVAPELILSGASTQRVLRQRGVIVKVTCDDACTARAAGTVSIPGASNVVRLRKATRALAANVKTKLKLKLSRKARKAIKRAFTKRKRLTATVTVRVTDAAGNSRSGKRKVKLRR